MKTLLLTAALMTAHLATAWADSTYEYWSSTAAGCVPENPAIQNNRYTVGAGNISHNGSNIDLISLYCPISYNEGAFNPDILYVTFKDEHTALGNFVNANLVRETKTTGATAAVANFTSDDFDATGGVALQTEGFTHTFDFGTYYYYVVIDLDRSSSMNTGIAFYGVGLQQQIAFGERRGDKKQRKVSASDSSKPSRRKLAQR